MNSEYVKISNAERIYGTKSLLQSQIFSINMLKRFRAYESLKRHELTLKIELRNKIENTLHLINEMSRKLPKVEIIKSAENDLFSPFKKEEMAKKKSMENELDEIRRKLYQLQ